MRTIYFCRDCKAVEAWDENDSKLCTCCTPPKKMIDSGITEEAFDSLSAEEKERLLNDWFGNSAKARLTAILNNPDKSIYHSETGGLFDDLISEDGSGLSLPLDTNVTWKGVIGNSLLLGKCGELYAQHILESWGYKVYTPLVDDHGIDMIAIDLKTGKLIKIQVKTAKEGNYTFIRDKVFRRTNDFYVFYIRVDKEGIPSVYLYPSKLWPEPSDEEITHSEDGHFTYHPYSREGQTSPAEYGISGAAKYYKQGAPYRLTSNNVWSFEKPEILK